MQHLVDPVRSTLTRWIRFWISSEAVIFWVADTDTSIKRDLPRRSCYSFRVCSKNPNLLYSTLDIIRAPNRKDQPFVLISPRLPAAQRSVSPDDMFWTKAFFKILRSSNRALAERFNLPTRLRAALTELVLRATVFPARVSIACRKLVFCLPRSF